MQLCRQASFLRIELLTRSPRRYENLLYYLFRILLATHNKIGVRKYKPLILPEEGLESSRLSGLPLFH